MDHIKCTQINAKLDAQRNGQLTYEELTLISAETRNELRESVAAYLGLIDAVNGCEK